VVGSGVFRALCLTVYFVLDMLCLTAYPVRVNGLRQQPLTQTQKPMEGLCHARILFYSLRLSVSYRHLNAPRIATWCGSLPSWSGSRQLWPALTRVLIVSGSSRPAMESRAADELRSVPSPDD